MTKNREKSQVTRKIVKLAIFSNFRNSVWLSDYEQDKELRKIVRLAIFRNTRYERTWAQVGFEPLTSVIPVQRTGN